MLNVAALSKPHVVHQLAAELSSSSTDVAVITETHFKSKHSDSVVAIPDYTVFRRDRTGRRGGGVAVYVRSALQSTIWQSPTTDSRQLPYQLLWVRVGCVFVCAVYHPPRPPYTDESLINYFDVCVTELLRDYPSSLVLLARDFNQLQNRDIIKCTGFTQLVSQLTPVAARGCLPPGANVYVAAAIQIRN